MSKQIRNGNNLAFSRNNHYQVPTFNRSAATHCKRKRSARHTGCEGSCESAQWCFSKARAGLTVSFSAPRAAMSGAGLEIHDAASVGDADTLEHYLKTGKCDVNLKDYDISNRTALHWACQKGYVDCIRLLLDHGAKGTARTKTDRWTPAHFAAESNRLAALRALHAANVPIDCKDKYGDTPRHIAIIYGHSECAKYLQQAESELAERRKKGEVVEEDDEQIDDDDFSDDNLDAL